MPKTIFVIDDDLGMQLVLEIALKDAGYEMVAASDGLQGIERLATLQPDLVISDVMMPQLDGVQVFNLLKQRLQDQGIPIIIMTALSRKPWFADMEAEGAVIIQKPFDVDHLLDMIRLLLDEGS
ncbi:MAG: response regulator [Herpetosiphonaceae bacterium]|nr:response regulator [Herpetosiphonaceae bacterium]